MPYIRYNTNRMKVITWNVRGGNRRVHELIRQALRFAPDILCLQEVPEREMPYLRGMPSYYVHDAEDFRGKDSSRNRYTVILTKKRPVRVQTIPYQSPHTRCLWDRLFYELILKASERRTAVAVEIVTGVHRKTVRFVSTRLPAAIGTGERLRLFSRIMQALDTTAITVFCGDLNVVDGWLLNRLSGWTRAFRFGDYLTNERQAFERLIARFGLVNIFRGVATWGFGLPFFQFDHILVPRGTNVRFARVNTRRFGSDHRMLLADIEI